jgi:hypothetical protein
MTPAQIQKVLDDTYNDFTSDFKPLYEAVQDLKGQMFIRIFEQFENTDGQKIPLPARKSPGASEGAYSKGYAKLKQRRPNPLELTGFLRNNFLGEPISENGLNAAIGFNAKEYEKAQGLQYGKSVNPRYTTFSGYGVIFQPTETEQAEFLELHAQLLAAEIQRRLSL